jgi:hypothetical protein
LLVILRMKGMVDLGNWGLIQVPTIYLFFCFLVAHNLRRGASGALILHRATCATPKTDPSTKHGAFEHEQNKVYIEFPLTSGPYMVIRLRNMSVPVPTSMVLSPPQRSVS